MVFPGRCGRGLPFHAPDEFLENEMTRGAGFQDLIAPMLQFANRLQGQPRQFPPFPHPGHFCKGLEVGLMSSSEFRSIEEDRFPEDEPAVLRLTRVVVTLQAG